MNSWTCPAVPAWDRFFFAAGPASPLQVFRAVFGGWLVTYDLRLYDILHLHLGRDGIVTADDVAGMSRMGRWSVFAWWAGDEMAFHLVFLLAILAAAALAAGWHVRLAAALTWATHLSLLHPIVVGANSADEIVMILTFLCLVAAAAGHLNPARVTIPAWSTRLFQIQIAMIYFFSGWLKTASPDWFRGEAMHFVFQQPTWLRLSCEGLDNPLIVGLITYGTLAFELVLFPTLVWSRSWRPWVLGAGVLFHLAIVVTMKVFVFGELMPITYLVFLSADSPVIRGAVACGDTLRRTLHDLVPRAQRWH